MTCEEAIDLLKKEQGSMDTEDAHRNADEILCQLLVAIGPPEAKDVVAAYQKAPKWYA